MDIFPFQFAVPTLTPVMNGDATASVVPEKQCVRMGVTVVVTENAPFDGSYNLVVETLPNAADGAIETGDRIVQINGAGTLSVLFSNPIMDRVRLRVQTDAITPANATFAVTFQSDREMTL